MNASTLRPLHINDGSIELLKWIAVLSMTLDHFNRFFLNESIYAYYCVGRLAMPLFGFVFAYNLARPGTLSHKIYFKSFKRLLFFGALATPAYMSMKNLHHLYPLNIMFTLLLTAIIFYFYENHSSLQIKLIPLIFFIGGFFVEYIWVGLFFCIACWFFCRNQTLTNAGLCLLGYFLLSLINDNNWALASLPCIVLASQINIAIPRIPYFFYIFYPAHLTLFWLITHLIHCHNTL